MKGLMGLRPLGPGLSGLPCTGAREIKHGAPASGGGYTLWSAPDALEGFARPSGEAQLGFPIGSPLGGRGRLGFLSASRVEEGGRGGGFVFEPCLGPSGGGDTLRWNAV
jgi:hypothetical protein